MKKALITGIDGQDGSFLAELLLEKGYEVYGLTRKEFLEDRERHLWRINHILKQITLQAPSMESYPEIFASVEKVKPDECYHFAAQSFVSYSFQDEFNTISTNVNGTHFMLAALKEKVPGCKFYFAGSSEMFGRAEVSPQNESTPFRPRSLYGISKVAGFDLTRNYRENYGMFALSGICYNHESERRGLEFVTRKITDGVARIKLGMEKELKLGNLEAERDWGYSPDYVRAMWMMLQQDKPEDYVIATGQLHSVQEFARLAFAHAGLNWKDYVVLDKVFFRPSEEKPLVGDAGKARKNLGWLPTIKFEDMVKAMVEADLERLKKT